MKLSSIFYFILFFGFVGYSQQKNTNQKLENGLLKLKNQAFCDCYAEVLTGNEKIRYKDGSTYVQLITLKGEYVFMNEKYNKMIKEWAKKKYKSYDPNQKLYLMQCLDFYNSPILKKFIDSVRQEEIKLTRKER